MLKPKTLKGLVHAGLAIGALIEALTTTSKLRKLLSGAAAGYHTHATMYHFLYEEAEPTWEEGTIGFVEEDYDEEYWDT